MPDAGKVFRRCGAKAVGVMGRAGCRWAGGTRNQVRITCVVINEIDFLNVISVLMPL